MSELENKSAKKPEYLDFITFSKVDEKIYNNAYRKVWTPSGIISIEEFEDAMQKEKKKYALAQGVVKKRLKGMSFRRKAQRKFVNAVKHALSKDSKIRHSILRAFLR